MRERELGATTTFTAEEWLIIAKAVDGLLLVHVLNGEDSAYLDRCRFVQKVAEEKAIEALIEDLQYNSYTHTITLRSFDGDYTWYCKCGQEGGRSPMTVDEASDSGNRHVREVAELQVKNR